MPQTSNKKDILPDSLDNRTASLRQAKMRSKLSEAKPERDLSTYEMDAVFKLFNSIEKA
jgi:hypothetical protein